MIGSQTARDKLGSQKGKLKEKPFYHMIISKKDGSVVKGHIAILKNERNNILQKRYDRIYCEYDEYSADIPENRLLKKALLFVRRMMQNMGDGHRSYDNINLAIRKSLALFENVSDEVNLKEVSQIKAHKLFKEYAEAIRRNQ